MSTRPWLTPEETARVEQLEPDECWRRTHWSVVIHGEAKRLSHEADIIESGVRDLPTMTSSSKWNYVRITPTSITGRRFIAN